ncbi:MAG: hypothetical protein ACTIL0_07140 [Microbacterium gubbeenense]
MTDPKDAHDALAQYADETDNTAFAEQLRKFAVAEGWEEPSANDIATQIRL